MTSQPTSRRRGRTRRVLTFALPAALAIINVAQLGRYLVRRWQSGLAPAITASPTPLLASPYDDGGVAKYDEAFELDVSTTPAWASFWQLRRQARDERRHGHTRLVQPGYRRRRQYAS